MNWPDLSLGGYGFYVWGSYLFALIAIAWEVVSLKQRRKSIGRHKTPERTPPSVIRGSANETTT
jgi:heme exporter protein CcmD